MSVLLDNAASISPVTEPFVRASSATTVEVELPASVMKQYLTVKAEGQKLWIRFTTGVAGAASGETLDETTVSAVSGSGNLLAANAASAWVIEAGEKQDFDLGQVKLNSNEALKLLHKSPATGGYIRMYASSGPKV